jgi:SlyX protein
MTHATTPDTIDHRLTELEIKASFSEDLLDQLNLVIVRQQQQIDQLVREMGHLRQVSADNSPGGIRNSLEDLPPHY